MNEAAARLGLRRGMALADARALTIRLAADEIDRQADAALLMCCVEACERFTPLVAPDMADGAILDITGCAHLFGGEEGLRARAVDVFFRRGLATRAVIAGTPDAARALARFGLALHPPLGMEEQAARSLPIAALEGGAETTMALLRAGMKTLGDLADRPRMALAARFGGDLLRKLDRVLGREDIRITPLRAPPDYLAERHFIQPLLDTQAIAGIAGELLDDLCAMLTERGQGGRRFVLALFRTDGQVRALAVETGAPCRDPQMILRLLKLKIETLSDPLDPGFGFDGIRLGVFRLERVDAAQTSFAKEAAQDSALAELVDRLVTRFGGEKVLRFTMRDSHDPDRAAGTLPATAPDTLIAWPQPEPGQSPLRPLLLLDPPHLIEAIAKVPDGPPFRFRWRRLLHEVAFAEGPERIAPEWWREGGMQPVRDYYRVEDKAGGRFWIFRDGPYDGAALPRWFLHGLFA